MPGSFASFGFSLIEALLVVALLGIMAILVAPYFTGSLQKTDLDRFAAEAADALREAQAAAMSGKLNELTPAVARYGVRFETNAFCLAPVTQDPPSLDTGTPANSCDGDKVLAKHSLTGFVSITAGIGNVTFTDRRGKPNAAATITFTASGDTSTTRNVTINAEGMIDIP